MAATSSCNSVSKWRKLLCILILVYLFLTFVGGILFVRVEGECQPIKKSENPYLDMMKLDDPDSASDESTSADVPASKESFPRAMSDNILPRSLPFLRLHLFCRKIDHPNYVEFLNAISASNHTKELHETLTSICQDYSHARRDVSQRLDNCTIWTMQNFITWTSFASSTIFTIGNGYVVPTTTKGILLVIIYCLIGMPIALSMLAIGSKLLIHYISAFIRCFEMRLLRKERFRRNNGKIMLLLFLILFTWLILGSAITSDDAMTGLPWLVSLYYWFQSVTTIGQIPYRVKMYEGWRLLLLVPYNIIFFGGLVTIVAMLSLSLNSIMQWKGADCCCMEDEDENEDEVDDEDNSCACALDEDIEEIENDEECFSEEGESKKPLLNS